VSIENQLKLQLIGVCALLGRISSRRTLDREENDSVAQALEDLVALYPDSLEIWNLSNGGYSLEVKR